MKKVLFSTAVCVSLLALAGMASAQLTSIDAIQYYNPLNGAAASPNAGQIVTVQGTLYIIKGTFNSGANYIQNNSVPGSEAGVQVYSSGNPYALGYSTSKRALSACFEVWARMYAGTDLVFQQAEPEYEAVAFLHVGKTGRIGVDARIGGHEDVPAVQDEELQKLGLGRKGA